MNSSTLTIGMKDDRKLQLLEKRLADSPVQGSPSPIPMFVTNGFPSPKDIIHIDTSGDSGSRSNSNAPKEKSSKRNSYEPIDRSLKRPLEFDNSDSLDAEEKISKSKKPEDTEASPGQIGNK